MRHNLEIECADSLGRNACIYLDGKPLEGVKSIDIHIDAEDIVTATVMFYDVSVYYDGESEVIKAAI